MRIVFFGTPEFAVRSLEALVEGHENVVAVVTQPDRARGRSRSNLEPPPVKARADSFVIPVYQPVKPAGDEFVAQLEALEPDLGVVVAYGHILKPRVLAVPKFGMINVHASLLPAWRGAAPIQWAIANGDQTTGVTIMRMEAGLDSGPILLQRGTTIGPEETGGQLTRRLAQLGAQALRDAIDRVRAGTATFTPQDHAQATIAPKLNREVARIDWTQPAVTVANRVRAFDPVPGAWTTGGGGDLKLFRPKVVEWNGPPGYVMNAERALVVGTGAGAVEFGEIQPPGKARLSVSAWLRGRPIAAGARLQ